MDVKLGFIACPIPCCQHLGNRFSTIAETKSVKRSTLIFLFLVLVNLPQFCLGQVEVPLPGGQAPTDQESQLVDGLLELIESRAQPKSTEEGLPLESPSTVAIPNKGRTGSGSTIAEDAVAADNPLKVIRTLMLDVSETMRRGVVGGETLQLQGDVIEHLDSLIQRLRQREAAGAMAEREEDSEPLQGELEAEADADSQQTPAEGRQTAEGTTSQEDSIGESDSSGVDQPQDSSEIGKAGDSPGQGGARPGLVAQPRDSGELQRSVWGHLPEQVRSQLQTRMAEQFLPSYREQLEAYFRALLNQESLE